jgi:hypothetical protein
VATFDELRQQAGQEIAGQGGSLGSGDTGLADQATDLLAALRFWAETHHRTGDDVREAVEVASGTTLKNIATELRAGGGDEALEASRRLESIAYSPSERLTEIFEAAGKVVPSSTADEPLWEEGQPL